MPRKTKQDQAATPDPAWTPGGKIVPMPLIAAAGLDVERLRAELVDVRSRWGTGLAFQREASHLIKAHLTAGSINRLVEQMVAEMLPAMPE